MIPQYHDHKLLHPKTLSLQASPLLRDRGEKEEEKKRKRKMNETFFFQFLFLGFALENLRKCHEIRFRILVPFITAQHFEIHEQANEMPRLTQMSEQCQFSLSCASDCKSPSAIQSEAMKLL